MNYFHSSSHLRELIHASKVSTANLLSEALPKSWYARIRSFTFLLPRWVRDFRKKVLSLFYNLWVFFKGGLWDQTKQKLFGVETILGWKLFWGGYFKSCSVRVLATMSKSCFLHFLIIVPLLVGTNVKNNGERNLYFLRKTKESIEHDLRLLVETQGGETNDLCLIAGASLYQFVS